ncbi:hypothetical protein DFH09DRAFT_1099740 [Mycena vulgaris]|nr:hypothetical protein DFH09DRAFT_1099740 [Mycena vulgaris]
MTRPSELDFSDIGGRGRDHKKKFGNRPKRPEIKAETQEKLPRCLRNTFSVQCKAEMTERPKGNILNNQYYIILFFHQAHRPPAMSGLPDVLKIPDGPEKLSIPAGDLPVSALIKLKLPPQRASSIYTHPTDYLSELASTITTFNAAEIVVPPSHVVKALGRAILLDPEPITLKMAMCENTAASPIKRACVRAKIRFFELFPPNL